MATPTIERIEAEIDRLSIEEQLRLMERLAHSIRARTLQTPAVDESRLAEMAADPEIQHELRQINHESELCTWQTHRCENQ